jgi:hypothetical protein
MPRSHPSPPLRAVILLSSLISLCAGYAMEFTGPPTSEPLNLSAPSITITWTAIDAGPANDTIELWWLTGSFGASPLLTSFHSICIIAFLLLPAFSSLPPPNHHPPINPELTSRVGRTGYELATLPKYNATTGGNSNFIWDPANVTEALLGIPQALPDGKTYHFQARGQNERVDSERYELVGYPLREEELGAAVHLVPSRRGASWTLGIAIVVAVVMA